MKTRLNMFILMLIAMMLIDGSQSINTEKNSCTQETNFFGKGMFFRDFNLPLPNNFKAESELEIFGKIPEDADRITINLIPEQGQRKITDIALNLNFKLSKNILVTNAMEKGLWQNNGKVSNLNGTNLVPGQNFSLKIECREDNFIVWMNDIYLAAVPHQFEPYEIIAVQSADRLFVYSFIYRTKRACVINKFEMTIDNKKDPYDDENACIQKVNFFGKGIYVDYFTLPFPNDLSPGTEIEIVGNIPQDTRTLNFNLIPTQPWDNIIDIAFHFNPRYYQNVTLQNSMLNGQWQIEEMYPVNSNLIPGLNFKLKVISTSAGFKIWINDAEYGTFNHRIDPKTVDALYSTTRLFFDHISYKTYRPCSKLSKDDDTAGFGQNTREIDFFGNGIYTRHLEIPIPGDMSAGTELVIFGNVPQNSTFLEFQLTPQGTDRSGDRIRFYSKTSSNKDTIIRSTSLNDISGESIATEILNFFTGIIFSIKITSTIEGYKIWINGIELPLYKYIINPKIIKMFRVTTPLFISRIVYKNKVMKMSNAIKNSTQICTSSSLETNNFIRELAFFGKGANINGFIIPLPDTFTAGTELQIFGTVPEDALFMEINLIIRQSWDQVKNIALHIHFRFEDEVVVVSSYQNGQANGEHICGINIVPGHFFSIRIISTIDGYEIWANGKDLAVYNHVIDNSIVTDLQMNGLSFIHQIIYKKLWLLGL